MLKNLFPRDIPTQDKKSKRLWLDLGDLGDLVNPAGPHEQWQDHGMGLLRTILKQNGIETDMFSTRQCTSWDEVERKMKGYDMLIMNVRSYNFPIAYRSAKLFKRVNPRGLVLTGGMHATVALDEMLDIPEFDKICQGPGENTIVNLVSNPEAFPRVILGVGAKSMAEWPMIDREMWPKPNSPKLNAKYRWPLEPESGWGPSPVATLITSRVCPWQCVFCNENSYIPNMGRRPVEMVIEELNYLDKTYGPLGSVVIHDSMFFQNPTWLEEWVEKYPKMANKTWPYWAAGRADTVRQWPDLFEAVVRKTNWKTVSIGFESGSDRVLKILNKECTEEDNYFAIDLLTRIGDDMEAKGQEPPVFWSNIMWGVPGETREDAFKTMRMIKYTKRMMPSMSFYAPYPGSALGNQLIAEGKSLMNRDNYHRFPGDEKLKGIDYAFYNEMLAGKFNEEIERGMSVVRQERSDFWGAMAKA
jgi:anaerobic magnesium-protoporphyrin IX monomethyl ester cyclase